MAFNGLFYLGAFNLIDQGVFWGVLGGLYLVIGLILTMGRRVVPFFIEKGVDNAVNLPNSKWLDISSLVLFLCFFISELFIHSLEISSVLALALFMVNAVRLVRWHIPGIWQKPLLWSLYLSLWMICLGFLMFALDYVIDMPRNLPIHALAFGGIGLITLGMMSRVALGHTGRNVFAPPHVMSAAFLLLAMGAVVRVLLPYVLPQLYIWWIGLSALCWCTAFLIFTVTYLPILIRPRIDGQPG
jgi:uncharacterized protein involved in response to NO